MNGPPPPPPLHPGSRHPSQAHPAGSSSSTRDKYYCTSVSAVGQTVHVVANPLVACRNQRTLVVHYRTTTAHTPTRPVQNLEWTTTYYYTSPVARAVAFCCRLHGPAGYYTSSAGWRTRTRTRRDSRTAAERNNVLVQPVRAFSLAPNDSVVRPAAYYYGITTDPTTALTTAAAVPDDDQFAS